MVLLSEFSKGEPVSVFQLARVLSTPQDEVKAFIESSALSPALHATNVGHVQGSARDRANRYEQRDEDAGTQVVRVWGDTAVVTDRFWIKGVGKAGAFDRRLWFQRYLRAHGEWLEVCLRLSIEARIPAQPRTIERANV